MQRTRLLIAVFLLTPLVRATSPAQTRRLPRAAALFGIVRDSASGDPIQKSWVCAFIPAGPSALESRCARVDVLGAYRLDSLPAVGMRISISCETIRGIGRGLAYDSLVFADSVALRRDWSVPTTGCDRRPVRRVAGVFRGHYTPGFESSEFIPCAADGWFIPGDSLDLYPFNARRAWATWPPGVGRNLEWPDAPRDRYGNSRYYVRWRGTVVGPGRYGHMGVSPFEFVVDTVLELRPPAQKDCR